MWDLIERMVGGREFHRVGPGILKALEFREVLLELWDINRGDNIVRFLIRSKI